MKYLFLPSPTGKHLKDGIRGTLHEFADTSTVQSPHPILTTREGVTDFTQLTRQKVPLEIANWRAKAILSQMGLLAQIEGMLDALPEPQRTVVNLAWNGDAKFAKNSNTVRSLAAGLGLDSDDLDAFFIAAENIDI